MLLDAILAYLHFGLIITLAGLLFSELALYRQHLERASHALLSKIDIGFGAVAGFVFLSGAARVMFGVKGAAFYMHNPMFWVKIALFVIVALLSIPPTTHYIKLGRENPGSGPIDVDAATYARMRGFLIAEVCILMLIPLFAVLMARGM